MGGGDAIGMLICVVVIALPIGLLIGAVILRAGVSFANKCLPTVAERDYDGWDDADDDEDDDRPRRRRNRRATAAIPEPAMGKAMGIVLVNAIIGFIISIPISLVLGVGFANMGGGRQDPMATALATLIQLPISFLVNAGIYTAMLPTTFPRACLVELFRIIIIIVIIIVIAVPLFALGFLLRGG